MDTIGPTTGATITAITEKSHIFESEAHGTLYAELEVMTTTRDHIKSEKRKSALAISSA